MNIEEFCAEHPEHKEIESTRRWVRVVSGRLRHVWVRHCGRHVLPRLR